MKISLKSSRQIYKRMFATISGVMSLSSFHYWRGGTKEIHNSRIDSKIFRHVFNTSNCNFFVTISYEVLTVYNKCLTLIILRTRLKVPIFTACWQLLSCLFWQSLWAATLNILRNVIMFMLYKTHSKHYLHRVSPKARISSS